MYASSLLFCYIKKELLSFILKNLLVSVTLMEKTCAYSETITNCQDSESSHLDQSHDALAMQMQAIKKRKRITLRSHQKKRRDDKINKRFWTLRNLIPNCTQMDKESVLDEAIVYLKRLQLQLQIIPTYAGLCVPPTPITYPSIDLRLGAGPLQLFGLPLVGLTGNGTKLEINEMSHHNNNDGLELCAYLPK